MTWQEFYAMVKASGLLSAAAELAAHAKLQNKWRKASSVAP